MLSSFANTTASSAPPVAAIATALSTRSARLSGSRDAQRPSSAHSAARSEPSVDDARVAPGGGAAVSKARSRRRCDDVGVTRSVGDAERSAAAAEAAADAASSTSCESRLLLCNASAACSSSASLMADGGVDGALFVSNTSVSERRGTIGGVAASAGGTSTGGGVDGGGDGGGDGAGAVPSANLTATCRRASAATGAWFPELARE